jgi:hypothetical protein
MFKFVGAPAAPKAAVPKAVAPKAAAPKAAPKSNAPQPPQPPPRAPTGSNSNSSAPPPSTAKSPSAPPPPSAKSSSAPPPSQPDSSAAASYDFKKMTSEQMVDAWAKARSDSQRKVIERKITEENARRCKLAEEQQKNSIPVSKKLKQKRSKIPRG